MVRERGIEANQEKIKAIMEMQVPRTQRDIQKLAGCFTALRRFILKLAERCLPFFELLKGDHNKKLVNWNPKCVVTFEEVKKHLMNPPILSKTEPGELLSLYLSSGPLAISAALIQGKKGVQNPVYYVSQVLKDTETRYPNLKKFS